MAWYIIEPEAETNLVTNPSLETVVTGYTAVGGTFARVATQSRRGSYSLEIDPTTGVNDGAFFGTVSLVSGNTYTFGVDVKGVSSIPYRIYFGTTGGAVLGTPTTFTGTGDWQRVYMTYTETATTTRRLYLVKNNSANGEIFYADGWHCSQKSYNTTYIDGDQEGCEWDGEEHASTSSRSAQSRNGGRISNLTDYGLYVFEHPDTGMPRITNRMQTYALAHGATYLGYKVEPRVFSLLSSVRGTSFTDLHSKRKGIIDLIKPDLVNGIQPIAFRYDGANSNKPVQIQAIYEDGLNMQDLISDKTERVGLRFVAPDPFFYEDGEASTALTTTKSASADYNIARIDGAWGQLGTGMNGIIYTSAYDKIRDRIYFGGVFTTANGVTVNRICYWNGTTFVAMDSGVNSAVEEIAVAPNGDVWIGGPFTTVGSAAAACKGLARWNVSGGTWTAFNPSTATFDFIHTLTLDSSGNLYIGGSFTDWDGIANADNIAQYNGTTWSALGTGMNGGVQRIRVHPDNKVYVTGDFTTGNGVTLNYVGYWDGATFVAMGSGLAGGSTTGRVIAVDLSGNIYIGGTFTSAGGVSANNIVSWNGAAFFALSSGTDNIVYAIHIITDGIVLVGGGFSTAGGLTLADRYAGWNGSSWFHISVNLPGAPAVYNILSIEDDLYLGFSTTGTATTSEITTVNNPGTSLAYPKITINRSGGTSAVVEWLRNETTGKTLYLNYALQSGETLTIDLTPGNRKIESSHRGNVIGTALLRNSDMAEFYLLPGDNDISAFVNTAGSPTMTSFISFVPAHWSIDGVAA